LAEEVLSSSLPVFAWLVLLAVVSRGHGNSYSAADLFWVRLWERKQASRQYMGLKSARLISGRFVMRLNVFQGGADG
jgi:hypothetical protein